MKASERLLKYAAINTSSDDASDSQPSSRCQLVLADMLSDELKELGAENVVRDGSGYVYGFLPSSAGCEKAPAVGFIAHMDTAPDFCGENVRPQIIENYDGMDIILPDGKRIPRRKFRHLEKLRGRTVITTDGTTLLGADDKAGIAEIMTAVERVVNENMPHGKIGIAFTPDEEIGSGVESL